MIALDRITPVRRSLQRLALLMVPISEVAYLLSQPMFVSNNSFLKTANWKRINLGVGVRRLHG